MAGDAEGELRVADVLAKAEDVPVRASCFHAHLAAEKAMKALVIFRGVPLRRSHDLAQLLRMLPEDDRSTFSTTDLAMLNPWSIEGRYPADLAEPSTTEVGVLAAAAGRVVATVLAMIER